MLDADERDYILDCYSNNNELTDTLYDAMEAYISADYTTGDKKMGDLSNLFSTAMKKCDKVMDKMDVLS